jgi:hypothetical protein
MASSDSRLRRPRLRWREAVLAPGLVRPLAIFAASRLVVLLAFLVAATVAAAVGDDLRTGRPWPPAPPGQSPTLTALTGWDGTWYAEIAKNGYGPRSSLMAFFPGFPVTVRAVAAGTGWSHATAAVLTGMLFGALATVLLWHLSRRLGGSGFADRSAALFVFFPGSFVFSMGYAEPLMLAAALGCLLALDRQQWALAGMCGALATFTRPNAVVLVACAAWAATAAVRRGAGLTPLLAPVLTLAGAGGYFAFLWRRTGSVLAWFDVQSDLWKESFSPGSVVRRAYRAVEQLAGNRPGPDLNFLLPTIGVVFAVVAFVWLARWRPPATLTIFAVGVVGLAAGSATLGLRPRFLLTAFPLLQAVAWKLDGAAFAVTLAISAAMLSGLVLVTVLTGLATP